MFGGWPARLISDIGTPRKRGLKKPLSTVSGLLTILSVIWARYMVGDLTSYRERVCWPRCACKTVVWEGVVASTWITRESKH